MLDAKVESGPELDPDDETEKLREEARLRGLLRDWERYSQRAPRGALDHDGYAPVPGLGPGLGPGPGHARGAGLAGLHPSNTSAAPSMASTGMHDGGWRRANLSWVPEQRPVGLPPASQAYPGRAVAWSHTPYQSFDGLGQQQGVVAQGLGSSWYSAASSNTAASSSATSSASSQPVGFRPYRQLPDAMGQWVEAGAGAAYDDPSMLYHGHGLDHGLGGDPYYQQQHYQAPLGRYGHLGQGGGGGLAHGLGHALRLPDQHLANSMVQLDKSGSTRTELA
ncbi:putative intracellular septation protein A [Frankliniella fusca]|uniref:Intracellular septation protein A n=1 Tax=Frankliniella fusca TaxID=407009 RepID=A0AAE1LNR6_9NEOP|nr:putative intracellular septation protein A [Frankliniella fusca]